MMIVLMGYRVLLQLQRFDHLHLLGLSYNPNKG